MFGNFKGIFWEPKTIKKSLYEHVGNASLPEYHKWMENTYSRYKVSIMTYLIRDFVRYVQNSMSLDLSPLDLYLRGHLKFLVYATSLKTQQELWQRAWVAYNTVKTSLGMYECVRQSTFRNSRACLEVERSNFEHPLQNRELGTS